MSPARAPAPAAPPPGAGASPFAAPACQPGCARPPPAAPPAAESSSRLRAGHPAGPDPLRGAPRTGLPARPAKRPAGAKAPGHRSGGPSAHLPRELVELDRDPAHLRDSPPVLADQLLVRHWHQVGRVVVVALEDEDALAVFARRDLVDPVEHPPTVRKLVHHDVSDRHFVGRDRTKQYNVALLDQRLHRVAGHEGGPETEEPEAEPENHQ